MTNMGGMTDQRWTLRDADDFGAPVSVSQVVARNVTAARELRGLTQDDLAVRLRTLTGSQWPRTAISMFESSWRNPKDRLRKFDVNQLVALSVALEVPLAWFFMPPSAYPDETGVARNDAWIRCAPPDADVPALTAAQLCEIAVSVTADTGSETNAEEEDPLHEKVRRIDRKYTFMTTAESLINQPREE